ncbi:uncharacterized protein LTR77_007422 [Saxophila tyrrhenica]|uniref:Zn(2)-C6 fungal-type domain-containing protein n=1 Tax=Saxophila tyrrhenica TaxID=1690608 RepID=A0AAV9P4P2_9PEZI|nr:hypothetical protein LTR77_007422 [Saxophila tyrrhenica]
MSLIVSSVTTNGSEYPPRRSNSTPACAVCQRRKTGQQVRCDRGLPCASCKKLGMLCTYTRKERQPSEGRSTLPLRPPGSNTTIATILALSQPGLVPDSGRQQSLTAGTSASQASSLSHIFLERVHPLTKIKDASAVLILVSARAEGSCLTPSQEALVCAIFMASVVSLTEAECQETFSKSRPLAVLESRRNAEKALSAPGAMGCSELITLQASFFHALALGSLGNFEAAWSLSGLVSRGATTRLNNGEAFQMSAFETEMCRRLWWAAMIMDAQFADSIGQQRSDAIACSQYDMPSAINDSHFLPNMQELPLVGEKPKETIFALFVAKSFQVMYSMSSPGTAGDVWDTLGSEDVSFDDKISRITLAEQMLAKGILQHCNLSERLHCYVINRANALMERMYFTAFSSQVQTGQPSQDLLEHSKRLLSLYLEVCETNCLHIYRWHARSEFPWPALTCLIRQVQPREARIKDADSQRDIIRRAVKVAREDLEVQPRDLENLRLSDSLAKLLDRDLRLNLT